jgi:hypothetical protein
MADGANDVVGRIAVAPSALRAPGFVGGLGIIEVDLGVADTGIVAAHARLGGRITVDIHVQALLHVVACTCGRLLDVDTIVGAELAACVDDRVFRAFLSTIIDNVFGESRITSCIRAS